MSALRGMLDFAAIVLLLMVIRIANNHPEESQTELFMRVWPFLGMAAALLLSTNKLLKKP